MPQSQVHNTDCIKFMQSLPDNFFSLAIADPPYGLDPSASGSWSDKTALGNRIWAKAKIGETWDKAPDQLFFDELLRVSKNTIIWGGNYFNLPPARCVICWDKVQPWDNFSQIELAWTTFAKPAKLFRYDNRAGEKKIHPCQKPVDLYAWLLNTFAKQGDTIFDPMMGSQSSRIAAYKLGFDYTGCELDKDYFSQGNARFDRECHGIRTINNKTFKQTSLFEE